MRSLMIFLSLGCVLLVLAALALGAMLSVATGWLSACLAFLFVLDTLVLLVIAARLTVWRGKSAVH